MDRQIVYAGAIPLETDLLRAHKNGYMALSKLAAAIMGTSNQLVNGLACTPTSPATLTVNIAPGEIYSMQNVDNTAYSSIPTDNTHQILKQGTLLDQVNLSCPAPGTGGFSINYLVQAVFAETDDTPVVLPYYNAANPSQAFNGPTNTGTAQNTRRANNCVVTVKAGTAATTGTQTTPTPDTSNVGLWVVTVANGQTTITSGNITKYTNAPILPSNGILAAFTEHSTEYADDSGAVNAYAVNLAIPPAAYKDGMSVSFSTVNANTSATPTLNVNGLGAVTVTAPGGGTLAPGQIPANTVKEFRYNSTGPRFELQDGMAKMPPGVPYADATGTANAIAVAYSIPNFNGLIDGYDLTIGISTPNTNTTPTVTPTINSVALSSWTVVKRVGNVQVPVAPGDLQGDAWIKADVPNTVWILQNPATAPITATTDATFADNSLNAPSTNWVRGAMAAIATAAGFASSFAANGYIKFPSWLGALVIQWGTTASLAAGATAITFPLAFPTACRSVVITKNVAGSTAQQADVANTISTTGFTLTNNGTVSSTFTWIAIGN